MSSNTPSLSRPPVLVVTCQLPALAQQRLEALTDVEVRQHGSLQSMPRAALLGALADADGLICVLSDRIDAEAVQAFGPRLRVVSTVSVGYDHVDVAAVQRRGVRIGNTPGVLTDATADTTVLLALMAARRAKQALALAEGGGGGFVLAGELGSQFTGKALGIIGLGRIGCATAARLLPFGIARVVYAGSRAHAERATPLGAEYVTLPELLRVADIVCICCPLTEQTAGLIGRGALASMKPSAILVNTARGAIVCHDALLEALDAGRIAHAALDVTDPEPLPVEHPLLRHPRCTVLPHIGSATEETRSAMANLAIDNALAGIQGRPMVAEVGEPGPKASAD